MNLRQLLIGATVGVASLSTPVAFGSEPIQFTDPDVRVFPAPAEIADGRSVVILPGGGYSHVAINHEGLDWAPFFNSLGITCAVVNYRLPHGDRSIPVGDAEAAIKLLKDSAEVWHLDPSKVGVMGSSAGGHLASTLATHSAPELRPAFQILFYPVISLEEAITNDGTRKGFVGETPKYELVREYSNFHQVDSL
ncbi:MAG: alpha/beta hydrolase, partial [Duncaniella sp.]|nr:alpha/beta hydrolase [Duncaniella sp.]